MELTIFADVSDALQRLWSRLDWFPSVVSILITGFHVPDSLKLSSLLKFLCYNFTHNPCIIVAISGEYVGMMKLNPVIGTRLKMFCYCRFVKLTVFTAAICSLTLSAGQTKLTISLGLAYVRTTETSAKMLNLPEDEGEGLGFRLTRTLWDPYPWVREVTADSRADCAGLKTGDCLLQADGRDLLGMPVGQVAGLIRGDGAGRGVSLLVWNCGVDPKDDPELLWSCGGGARGERARRALAGVVKALACSVCASTATKPLNCARSHIYCEPCWMRLERCALCRESLPPKTSPYARNLVAEQVFEAIATEYELKNAKPKPLTQSTSAYTSPNRSPNLSPSPSRRGQYQHSMMKHKKTVHFPDKFGQTYASDPNIHRSVQSTENRQQKNASTILVEKSNVSNSGNGGNCSCQNENESNVTNIPKINIQNVENGGKSEQAGIECSSSCQNLTLPHKLVARLRQACSLADLQNVALQCPMSRSLNSLGDCKHEHHGSLDNFKTHSNNMCDSPVYLLPAPPIYVVACDHSKTEQQNCV